MGTTSRLAGTLVDAVARATGRTPEVAGKPEAPIFRTGAQRLGRTVDKRTLALKTLPASALVANRASSRPARSQLSRARAVRWTAPVAKAVKAGIASLDKAASSCASDRKPASNCEGAK